MKKLNKKQWKDIENMYPFSIKSFFKPPKWAIDAGMISDFKYRNTLAQIELLEADKTNMQYLGTAFNKDDTYCEYYLNDINNLLYVFLYEEVLEYIYDTDDDLENCDVIHTGKYICCCVSVQNSTK